MRARIRGWFLAVVFGVLVSYAVALAAMTPPATSGTIGLTREQATPIWRVERVRTFGRDVVRYWCMQISGVYLSMPTADYRAQEIDLQAIPTHLRPTSIADLDINHVYVASGWPMRAVAARIDWLGNVPGPTTYASSDAWMLTDATNGNPRAIPLRPRWAGLVVDSLFYGGAGLLLIRFARAMLAAVRRRRGRCPACGYDAKGLTGCPECGRTLPQSR